MTLNRSDSGDSRGTCKDASRREASRLRREGQTLREIAAVFNVSSQTVLRWTDPAYEARQRASSSAAKRRRGGVCVDCGGRTSLGNDRRPAPALRCHVCRKEYEQREFLYWTRERAIEAARAWARTHGRPPAAADWPRVHPDRLYPNFAECYGNGSLARREGWRTWNDYLRAAGLPTLQQGHRHNARAAA